MAYHTIVFKLPQKPCTFWINLKIEKVQKASSPLDKANFSLFSTFDILDNKTCWSFFEKWKFYIPILEKGCIMVKCSPCIHHCLSGLLCWDGGGNPSALNNINLWQANSQTRILESVPEWDSNLGGAFRHML